MKVGFFSKLFGEDEQKPEVEERNFFNIKVGDIIAYNLEDYQVVGKMKLNDGSYQWYEYQLLGEQKSIWLSAEMDDELELGMFEKVNKTLSEPIPKEIEVDGVRYVKTEEGRAHVQGEGRSERNNGEKVHYFDFEAEESEQLASVEIWGGEIEVSQGKPVDDFEVQIIAGS